MKFLQSVSVFVLFLSTLLFAGCGGRKTAEAMESDANGYQCDQCGLKFYTDTDVLAGSCPACKPGTPFPVVGLVCPKDNHTTIIVRGKGAVCEQCKAPVDAIRLPHESELKAWGAVKKTKEEVAPK